MTIDFDPVVVEHRYRHEVLRRSPITSDRARLRGWIRTLRARNTTPSAPAAGSGRAGLAGSDNARLAGSDNAGLAVAGSQRTRRSERQNSQTRAA